MSATLTRPQNSTSNFLAKAVGDTAAEGATEGAVVEREEKHFSEGSLPPEEVLLEMVVMSSLRAELLPACLNVLIISGTSFCSCLMLNRLSQIGRAHV